MFKQQITSIFFLIPSCTTSWKHVDVSESSRGHCASCRSYVLPCYKSVNDVQTVKLLHFLNASSVLQWVSIFCWSINLLLLFSWLPCSASCALNSDRLLEASSRCERVLMLIRRISHSPNMWAAFKDLLSLAEKKLTQRTLKYRRLNLLLQNKDNEIGLSHFVSFFVFLLTYRYSWLSNLRLHWKLLLLLLFSSFWKWQWSGWSSRQRRWIMKRLRAHYADTSGELYWHTEGGGSCEPCGLEAVRPDSVPRCCGPTFFFFNLPTPPRPSGRTRSRTLPANEDWQVYSLRWLKIDQTINFSCVLPFVCVCVGGGGGYLTTKKQEM